MLHLNDFHSLRHHKCLKNTQVKQCGMGNARVDGSNIWGYESQD